MKKKNTDPSDVKKSEESLEEKKEVQEPLFDDIESKSPFLKVFLSVLVVVLIVVSVYFLLKKDETQVPKKSEKIQKMQALASKIDSMKSEVNSKQDEIFNLITQYKKQGGSDIPTYDSMNLSNEEKKLLEQRIAEEKDNSVKSLLNGILDKNKEIGELNKKIAEIELLLPKPHIVQKGENHFDISMDYLLNQKGIEKKRLKNLLKELECFQALFPDSGYGIFIQMGYTVHL